MTGEIGFGGNEASRGEGGQTSQLVPMRIGNATVFVEQVGKPAEIQTDDTIYPVSPPTSEDAFDKAGEILQECVRIVGEKVEDLAGKARPRDITVEFSLSFEAGGKAQLIPVLFTGETKAKTGLKVTAVWGPKDGVRPNLLKGVRGIQAARDATVYVCDRNGTHRGQGLLLDLREREAAVLTCHHVIAPVRAADLRVKIRQADGRLGEPVPVRYDGDLSHPTMDVVVLRIDKDQIEDKRPLERRPLLHKLDSDEYNGSLEATVFTYLEPYVFGAKVGAGTYLDVPAETSTNNWPGPPERYRVRAFLLREPDDAREGISGGVVLCEGGVLGLVHFSRVEGPAHARQGYVVPLTVWAEGWDALKREIEPLIDKRLRTAAKVKGVSALEVSEDVVIARYRSDVYLKREADQRARTALKQNGAVIIVGRPKSGKTRLAWELVHEQESSLVVIPDVGSPRPPDAFEEAGLPGNNLILFFDDLHSVARTMQPLKWRTRLEKATKRRCLLICTARDGSDWEEMEKEQGLLLDELGAESAVFVSKIGGPGEDRGEDLSDEDADHLAAAFRLSREEFAKRFDGTPGSLVLDLKDMSRRYKDLRKDKLGEVLMSRLLDSAKLLNEARQPSFRAPILRAVAEEIRGNGRMSPETWDELVLRTQEEGFARFDKSGNLLTYRPYLEQCVTYTPSKEEVADLQPILSRERDAIGLMYLGSSWSLKEDYLRAIGCFQETLRLDPDLAGAHFAMGYVLRRLGRHAEALEALEAALRIGPEDDAVFHNKGYVLEEFGKYEEALEAYEAALRLRPDYVEAFNNKGYSLNALGRHEEALEALEAALRLRPDYAEALVNKGVALDELGRHEEALEAYEATLRLGSTPMVNPHRAIILGHKGGTLHALGRYEEALEALEAALRLEPENVGRLRNKGVVLSLLTRYEEALEALEAALRLRPDYAEALIDKGNTLHRLGRYQEALEALEAALRLEPDYAEAFNHKGNTLHRLGRYQEALEAYNAALRLRPDYSEALRNMIVTLLNQEKEQEAIELLCQAWRRRESLTDQGASLSELFSHLDMNPEEC